MTGINVRRGPLDHTLVDPEWRSAKFDDEIMASREDTSLTGKFSGRSQSRKHETFVGMGTLAPRLAVEER
jgi:hypothetical protein